MKKAIFFLILVMSALLQNSKAQNVGIGTSTPKAPFNVAENKTVLFGADSNGLGNKLIWYAAKGAFRVGNTEVDSWNFNKIGNFSLAAGRSTTASGESSTAIGAASIATGRISTAMGNGTEASGDLSTAFGYKSVASGNLSIAAGNGVISSGDNSIAIGYLTTARSFGEVTVGANNTDYSPLGSVGWNSADRLFVVGNGASSIAKSDAMVILKNGNTGIGTSTPTEKLEVAGKIKTTNLQITNAAAIGKVLTSDGSGNASWVTPVSTPAYWTASGNNIYSSNTGNVGIGTNIPVAKLHIADSNVLFTGPAIVPNTTTYLPPAQGAGTRMMWYPQKAAFRVGGITGTQWNKDNIGSYSFASGYNNKADGYVSTAIGYAANASDSGSIAIGDNSTASGIDAIAIGGGFASGISSFAFGFRSASFGRFSTSIGLSAYSSGIASTSLGYYTNARSFNEVAIGAFNTDYIPISKTDWNNADRLFVVGNGSYVPVSNGSVLVKSDAMVILKNGNTGIGTSTPTYKLHIGNTDNGVRIEGPALTGSGGSSLNIGSTGDVIVDAPGITGGRFVLKENGNIGIGETNPGFPLNFYGSLGDKISLFGNAANGSSIGFGIKSGLFQMHSYQASDDIAFGYGSSNSFTEQMRIKGNGNVGIGTSNPTARLHVADSAVLFTGPATLPGSTTYPPPAQGAGTRMMWYPQKAAFRVGGANANEWDFNNIGKYSFAIGNGTKASGDYSTAMGYNTMASGIFSTAMGAGSIASGYTSLATGIKCISSGDYSTTMGSDEMASGVLSTAIGSSGSARSFVETSIGTYNTDYTPSSTTAWYATDRLFVIGNGNFGTGTRSDAMVVLKNGNTGIGVSNPTYKLHLGNSNNGLRIEGPELYGSGGSALNIGGVGDVVVDANGVVGGRFLIKENGNIGINKTNPGYKLDVGGDINASGQVRANGVVLSSDARFKQNITTLPDALNNLLQLRGTNYFFNTNSFPEKNFLSDKQMGVVAQEVEKIYPELVSTDKDGYKSVNYIGLIPVMIESIKEQQRQIDELKKMMKEISKK